eukprot:scaffold21199_cov69-Skeletonema_marinoi.AAC.1
MQNQPILSTKLRSSKDSTHWRARRCTESNKRRARDPTKATMEESNDDTTMAAGAEAVPKQKRRRTKSGISRNRRGGKQKKSNAPHAPNVQRNPSQPTQAPTSDNKKTDPRVYDLKRATKRRDKQIEALSADNQQLKRKVETTAREMQSVERETAMKVNAIEKGAEKLQERAEKKMKRAAEVTTTANVKMAAAAKAATDAKEMKKEASKEKTIATGMNASAVGQARINGDFYRVETELQKKKKEDADETQSPQNGTVIDLPPQLLKTVIEFALSKTKQVRKKEQLALRNQQEKRAQRLELMKKAGYEKATQRRLVLDINDDNHAISSLYRSDEIK